MGRHMIAIGRLPLTPAELGEWVGFRSFHFDRSASGAATAIVTLWSGPTFTICADDGATEGRVFVDHLRMGSDAELAELLLALGLPTQLSRCTSLSKPGRLPRSS